MASSWSSSSCKYDVFLSSRGKDTRDNFTSRHCTALYREKIKTFIHDVELGRGDEISAVILPVFFCVDSSDIRKQNGSFGDCFDEHETQFKKMLKKVQTWRLALTEALKLFGRDSANIRELDILRTLLNKIQERIGELSRLQKPKCAFVPSKALSVKKPRHLAAIQINIRTAPCWPNLFQTAAADYGQEIDGLHQLVKLQVLGQGNSSTVFKVQHKQTRALYALKVMQCDRGTPPHPQELNILRQTNSPYIVKCHQIFTKPSGELSILMEYMDAGSLESYVKSCGGLSEDLIGTISRQVLKGLAYMYSKNIVHRDIKPANLLINKKMEIKIADFGISKILEQCLERCNTPVGTYAYMSPERFDTEKHGGYDGFAADIWSFGVTMMELYLGYYPYLKHGQKPDHLSLELAICHENPPACRNVRLRSSEILSGVACRRMTPARDGLLHSYCHTPFFLEDASSRFRIN